MSWWTMSDTIIRLGQVSKVYRLYAKPQHRLLDMFGLLGKTRYTEHMALNRIDLVVRRGEKVAVIGRNGAGKSTLLKIITKVVSPTSGRVDVHGEVSALLQIGTGFHPDFSGRENVYGYLAQLGMTGKKAERRVAEVIDFSELEEYIDQPVKTYSTGMAARLMFSAATTIVPEILVLDEILSVGDAYFSRKCFERMDEMCSRSGTTLLLVTHDVYSALRICERIIWIDQGRIIMDDAGRTVVKAYEDSIREQEENRLRTKKQNRLREIASDGRTRNPIQILVEIQARENRPQACPVLFGEVSLATAGRVVASLPLGPDAFEDETGSHLVREGGNWGEVTMVDGRRTRPLLNYGSPFRKVSGVLVASGLEEEPGREDWELLLEYRSEQPCDLQVRAFIDGSGHDLGPLPPSNKEWVQHRVGVRVRDARLETSPVMEPTAQVNTTGVHGTGTISIADVRIFDGNGKETHILTHAKPAEFLISYRINKPQFNEKVQLLLAFHKDGTQDVCRLITRDLVLDASRSPTGLVRMFMRRMALAEGNYSVTIMVAEEGYYDRTQVVFFSINPGVHVCVSRLLDFRVVGGGLVGTGTVFVDDAEWSFVEETGAAVRDARGSVCDELALHPHLPLMQKNDVPGVGPVDVQESQQESRIRIDFPRCLETEFPGVFDVAWSATEDSLAAIAGVDFSDLEPHSPALRGFDWTTYVRCSAVRIVRALAACSHHGIAHGRMLDFGSYFGNFSLAFARAGYDVDAMDCYATYGAAMSHVVRALSGAGVSVLDTDVARSGLQDIDPETYDLVICMGVIEHVPHTPRLLLEGLHRVMKHGGHLVLDTPNLAYIYKRQQLARGDSVLYPLEHQFETQLPFEGHHREYTPGELRWMLERIGHEDVHIDTFNYSLYGLDTLDGTDLQNYKIMEADPSCREIIISISRKA